MSDTCSHVCSDCDAQCGERAGNMADFRDKPHELSHIKKVIGIMSGKGGVGKSLVTSLLAVLLARKEYKTAILDADITGPSIPRAFGVHGMAEESALGLHPMKSKLGTSIMSINLLLKSDTDPVIWRGPVLAGAVKQFWTDVIWDEIDFMLIDLPPGTGDVPLTVFQSIPVDGVIVVTSPQELVSMIVEKAVNMAKQMNIPILGLVENMSYALCPDCGREISLFGESSLEQTARRFGISTYARIPLDPKLAAACDQGIIELFEGNWLDHLVDALEKLLP